MEWKEYENRVFKYFKARFSNCKFDRNIKILGRFSKTQREIDILLTSTVFGCSMQLVIECKNWQSKLDVSDIGSFIDKLNDIGISKGIMISRLGYTEGAHKRARSEVNVQLQVLDFENLPKFYGFWANPYRGNIGAIISAPNGWIVNSSISKKMLKDMLCFLHPMEYTPEIASRKRHFMYFQIHPVIEENNLSTLMKKQDEIVLNKYPKSKIIYSEENTGNVNIKYRQIEYIEENYIEFTGGVELDDFYAYCVCIAPSDFNPDDLARLKYVMNTLHLIKMEGVDPTNSHNTWKKLFNKDSEKGIPSI
jgi:hypothetical protein